MYSINIPAFQSHRCARIVYRSVMIQQKATEQIQEKLLPCLRFREYLNAAVLGDQNAHSQPLQSVTFPHLSYKVCRSPQCRQDYLRSLSDQRNQKKMFLRWASYSDFGFHQAISDLRTTNLTSKSSTVKTKTSLAKSVLQDKASNWTRLITFHQSRLVHVCQQKENSNTAKNNIDFTLFSFLTKHIKTVTIGFSFVMKCDVCILSDRDLIMQRRDHSKRSQHTFNPSRLKIEALQLVILEDIS